MAFTSTVVVFAGHKAEQKQIRAWFLLWKKFRKINKFNWMQHVWHS